MLLTAITAAGTPTAGTQASPSPQGLAALPFGSAFLSFPVAAEGRKAKPVQYVIALKLPRELLRVFACPSQPFPGTWVQGAEQGRGTTAPREIQFSFAPVRDRARAPLEPGLCCKVLPVHGIQSQSCAGASPQPRAKGKGSWRGSPPQPGTAMSPSTSGMGTAPLQPHQHSFPHQVSKKGFPEKPHTL